MTEAKPSRRYSPAAPPSDDTPANKPVEKFHEGSVHVSIWENGGTKGLFRTATFQLRYKDGDEWKTGHSYGPSDLERLEKAAAKARARIGTWQQAQTRPASTP